MDPNTKPVDEPADEYVYTDFYTSVHPNYPPHGSTVDSNTVTYDHFRVSTAHAHYGRRTTKSTTTYVNSSRYGYGLINCPICHKQFRIRIEPVD